MSVDLAESMLARARNKIRDDLSGRTHFQKADLNAPLKFPDGHFDYVISISVLQAVADPAFTLHELCRVLKPGGTLILSLPRRDPPGAPRPVGELIRHHLRHLDERTLGKVLLVAAKCLGERHRPTPTWTELQIREMLSSTGLETVAVISGRQLIVVAEKTQKFNLCFC